MNLSKAESEAFAGIVAQLIHREQRRLRRTAATVSGFVLTAAVAIVWLVLHWPWGAITAFAAGSVVGLLGGLFAMARRLFIEST